MDAKFFEDVEIGQVFESVGRTITDAEVSAFAGLSGDFNQLHTDDEFAKKSPFGGRIAHGLLIVSIMTGLTQRMGIFEGTALALLDLRWQFKRVVKIGDTVRFRMTITEKSETSTPERGVIARHYEVLNQDDDVVQEGTIVIMIRRRG